jgi:hypothetical protein
MASDVKEIPVVLTQDEIEFLLGLLKDLLARGIQLDDGSFASLGPMQRQLIKTMAKIVEEQAKSIIAKLETACSIQQPKTS